MCASGTKMHGAADRTRKYATRFSCLNDLHVGSQSDAIGGAEITIVQ
jgi:hypothetical protein